MSGLPGTHPGEHRHPQHHCESRPPLLPGPGDTERPGGSLSCCVLLCLAGHHQGGTNRHPGFPRAGHGDGRPVAPEVSRAPSRAPATCPGQRRRLRAALGAPWAAPPVAGAQAAPGSTWGPLPPALFHKSQQYCKLGSSFWIGTRPAAEWALL